VAGGARCSYGVVVAVLAAASTGPNDQAFAVANLGVRSGDCVAPKARSHYQELHCAKGAASSLAWGDAPGIRSSTNAALKARFSVSIPDMPLIEIDAVPSQQLAVFLLKSASAMVVWFRLDVLQHSLKLTRAH